MTISLRLLETEVQISKNINRALADRFNTILKQRAGNIVSRIQSLIPTWIKSQPEMISLLSSTPDSLAGQFGIYQDVNDIVNSISNSVTQAVTVKIKPYTSNLKNGGFEINVQPNNFINLLSLPAGHTVYENGDLHWLNWLLTRGDQIIIVGYEYNPQIGFGRSKLGNMREGKAFRVPPQFSGTEDDNFITRALSGPEQEKEITKIFQDILGA